MKFNCLNSKKVDRYNCLGVKGVCFSFSMIMNTLYYTFTWIYLFLSIFAFPFVIIGWLEEKANEEIKYDKIKGRLRRYSTQAKEKANEN